MASTTNANPLANSATATHQPAYNGQRDGGQPRQPRSGNGKIADRGRKESPVDQGRRPPSQKAWTAGTNPLTQKAGPITPMNGNGVQSRSNNASRQPTSKDAGLTEKQSHDRLCFILGAALGLQVSITARSGEQFDGILAGSVTTANTTKVTLHMAKKILGSARPQANGSAIQEATFIGTSPEHALTFEFKDLADVTIPHFSLPESSRQLNGVGSTFQTDTDISNGANRGGKRILQKWVPEGADDTGFSLDAGGIGRWDQFEAHKKKFGDVSTYDENLYTTSINRSAPDYAQRAAKAERMAFEINNEQSSIAHVREERGQVEDGEGENEEDKYSGVRRSDKTFPSLPVGRPNKYTPPARRAPTAQPTIPGVPVDSAIISAQLSKPGPPKTTGHKVTPSVKEPSLPQVKDRVEPTRQGEEPKAKYVDNPSTANDPESNSNIPSVNTLASVQPNNNADNPTEDVENKVLDHFRHFAKTERKRFEERKRAQASQDRTARLNDFVHFSKTFKLKTPVPTDLLGILAKDPVKQEAIIEKAQKQVEDAKSGPVVTPANTKPSHSGNMPAVVPSNKTPVMPKFDASQLPAPLVDRASFNRGRGGYPPNAVRNDRAAQPSFSGRGAPSFAQRNNSQQERKSVIPSPISLGDGRVAPTGPLADQNPSPQRSALHTPLSATSTRFNVKATEFRPNINAPTFNPSATSNTPSSPSSAQQTSSVSRTASPSSFFGSRKLKAVSERVSLAKSFNPVARLRKEQEKRKSEKTDEPFKDYSHNGGIPNAYHTAPTWTVKEENGNKKYIDCFARISSHSSPSQSRSSSVQQVPFSSQVPSNANGMTGGPHLSAPQHGPPSHPYNQQYDEHRMPHQSASPQIYPSPRMAARQMSNFSSPMTHQAQLAYGQPQFYGAPTGQMPIQMRQFPATPGMMHTQPGQMAAPMMVQQQSSGPYMGVPQPYNQMGMYSPNPSHVYPQQSGFPSPGRMAPIMMHQNSQQGHHGGQQVMYSMPAQGGPIMYATQQGQVMGMRPAYGGHPAQYGSSPHQGHQMQQRAMSNGYGQKNVPQMMTPSQGTPANAPQQPAAFGQIEISGDDAK